MKRIISPSDSTHVEVDQGDPFADNCMFTDNCMCKFCIKERADAAAADTCECAVCVEERRMVEARKSSQEAIRKATGSGWKS